MPAGIFDADRILDRVAICSDRWIKGLLLLAVYANERPV